MRAEQDGQTGCGQPGEQETTLDVCHGSVLSTRRQVRLSPRGAVEIEARMPWRRELATGQSRDWAGVRALLDSKRPIATAGPTDLRLTPPSYGQPASGSDP